jgi:hypothetical protein
MDTEKMDQCEQTIRQKHVRSEFPIGIKLGLVKVYYIKCMLNISSSTCIRRHKFQIMSLNL